MKFLDGIKPEPKSYLEEYRQWQNNFVAQWIGESSFSKTIEVK